MITAADFTRFAGPQVQAQAHHVQNHADEPAAGDAPHVVIHVPRGLPAMRTALEADEGGGRVLGTSLAPSDSSIPLGAFAIHRHPELNHPQEQPQGMGSWLRRLFFRCA